MTETYNSSEMAKESTSHSTANTVSSYAGEKEIIDYEATQEDIARIVSRASMTGGMKDETNVLSRLATISKKLSHKNTSGGFEYQIDPNDFDLHRILRSFLQSADEQGIHLRSTGVVFKDVTTKGKDSQFSFAPTVKDLAFGPFYALSSIGKKKKSKAPTEKKIIRNVTGIVKPGEMCLVLGRPGAGCSSLLKTIAGEQDQFTGVEGDIHYDGIPQKEMMSKYKSDVIYNGELDVHYPHLTVDQTLRFAIGCKTPHTRVNNATREAYITANRDLYATIFGLTHTFNTKVGNDYIRGVSGGERKRVSIAEAMAAKGTVYCWDNATRGLDASTALEYAQAIRTTTNLTKSVAFVTIYQAGETIYECFDKVLVLYEGRQVFFGKAEAAKQYFIDLGFECPARQSTAEYLTAVTDVKGRVVRPGFENTAPKTADDFEQAWRKSALYAELLEQVEKYEGQTNGDQTRDIYDKSLALEKNKVHHRYTISYLKQLQLLTTRSFQRTLGDASYQIIDGAASVIQALISGSLYYNTPPTTAGAFSRGGIVFFMVLYYSLMGLAAMTAQFAERPILMKQKSYSFFHPSAEVLAGVLTRFPFKFCSLILFYVLIYFLSNLARKPGQFFINLLFLTLSSETITALFQTVAALCDDAAAANAISGLFLLAVLVYTGFMIQLKSMHPWFKWISYINPIRWSYESMMSTEFHGRMMDCGGTLVPSGPGYEAVSAANQVCAFVGSEIGQSSVSGDNYMRVQFSYHYSHVWRNLGFLIAFLIFFIAINAFVTEYKRAVKGGGDQLYFKRGAAVMEEDVVLDSELQGSKDDPEAGADGLEQQDQLNKLNRSATADDVDDVFTNLGSTGTFVWQNIDYVIPYKGATRKLLDNVQGYVKPGTLTALMGESGAGKTTLLNILSQRVDFGTITGDFLVNGKPLDATFKRSTGYVQQQDLHISELTVRESLQFAARLRRPASVPDSEKLDYVEKIIAILDMKLYADAIVGALGSGLNVEQRKKLSIGVELVAKPSLLLFLDEPTSGLDSQSAWSIVQLLRKLAGAGQSILCTIHQPSATLFESFDRLLLLRKGGQTVYFGDIGENSRDILGYFERHGARKCETHENPAEYILEAIGAGATASVKENWFDIWKSSEEFEATTKEVSLLKTIQTEDGMSMADNKELHNTFAIPYWSQLMYVIRRTGVQFYRSPQYVMSKMMLMVSAGLFVGFTFWAIKDSIVGLQNSMFAAFLSIVISAPLINQIQARAIDSRELFEVRESKSNTYHWSTLLIAQFVNELPYQLVFGTMYFCCLYFPLKLFPEASRSILFFLFHTIMFQLFFVSLGLAIVYFAPDLPSASVLTGLFLSFLISFCGVVQPYSLMPKFWTFMYRVSPLTYFVQNLLSVLIHGKKVVCAADELSYLEPPQGQTCGEYLDPFLKAVSGYVTNPEATSQCGYCRYTVGDEYLLTVGVKFSYIWRNYGLFWVYIIFNLVAMCVLYYIFRVNNYNPIASFQQYMESRKNKKESK
ncbi:hypothetical protein WICPIJ_009028 [Wickerhamomyces pijperi]|uniref:ABC transporter domain-containing protein n=1 Tax=Wickerhamomyces pijperi TaxID=599730 RepID=A0A9P8PTS5_WICPI|nr:hypothetical protein WICPIJ_009028 [Wickerhamomyces pijperi]